MKRQFLALSLLASTTFGALGGFAPAQAATISEREKNNTDLTAQVLPPITSNAVGFTEHVVKGANFLTDVDFYRVDIAPGHRLAYKVTLGYFTELYHDANNNGRAETSELVDQIHSTGLARILEGMDEGTFFFKVFTVIGLPTLPQYSLLVTVGTGLAFQKEVEPNNAPEQATRVEGFLVGRRALQGSVHSDVDRLDYYRFKVGTARLVGMFLRRIGSGGSLSVYHDKNRNGRIDSGEFLQKNQADVRGDAQVIKSLKAGEYIVEVVKPFGSGSASYTLFLST